MPNALSSWFQNKYGQLKWRRKISSIPKDRPRPISPPPGGEITGNGLFFQKLPAELRSKILVEAFGDRVVHMDLAFDYPPLLVADSSEQTSLKDALPIHCGLIVRRYPRTRESLCYVDRSQKKEWRWRSSVCHRDYRDSASRPPGRRVQPAQDKCRFGGTARAYCDSWPGEWPSKCSIGVMGWLLSCRQAYVEGIHVLYATNTIHTSSKEIVMSLPRLLVPRRLETIKSVEILWDFAPFLERPELPKHLPFRDHNSFLLFLDTIPVAFPGVRSLYISLQGRLHGYETREYPPSDEERLDILEKAIMLPVDIMVRNLSPQVDNISIAIPSSLYIHYRTRAKGLGWKVEQTCRGDQLERHWRPLANCESRSGYWVCLGQKDLRRPCLCLMVESEDDPYNDLDESEDAVLYGLD